MFFKKPRLNYEKLKSGSFKDEYDTYLKIKDFFKQNKLKKDKITFVNLGAGGDIINPLLFTDALIKAKEITFLFYDPRFYYHFMIEALKDIVDNFKYKLKFDKNTALIRFKLNNTKFNLIYSSQDAFAKMPSEFKKGFDVYYERAFRLFRDDQDLFMFLLFEKLNKGGIAITDWGFNKPVLEKNRLEKIQNLPEDFGIYKKLKIYKKI